MKKFVEEDVLGTFRAIMETKTEYYQSDFELDAKVIADAAKEAGNTALKDRTFLWMARSCGTWCLPERNVFLKDSWEYQVWLYYGEQTGDRILAYRVEVSGIENGKVRGRLHELDYSKHVQHVKSSALPADRMEMIYERGTRIQKAEKPISRQEDPVLGRLKRFVLIPNDPDHLVSLLYQEHEKGERLRQGDAREHIASLRRKADRIRKKKAAVK